MEIVNCPQNPPCKNAFILVNPAKKTTKIPLIDLDPFDLSWF
jgi:hypothetical protein